MKYLKLKGSSQNQGATVNSRVQYGVSLPVWDLSLKAVIKHNFQKMFFMCKICSHYLVFDNKNL